MSFSTLPGFNLANYFSGECIPGVHIARKDSKLMLLVKQSKVQTVSLTSMHTSTYFRFILSQNFPYVLLIALQFLLFNIFFQSFLSASSLLPVHLYYLIHHYLCCGFSILYHKSSIIYDFLNNKPFLKIWKCISVF